MKETKHQKFGLNTIENETPIMFVQKVLSMQRTLVYISIIHVQSKRTI